MIEKIKTFSKTTALDIYYNLRRQLAIVRMWLIEHGYQAALEEVEKTGNYPEDIIIRNQELILKNQDLEKENAGLKKLVYSLSTQNQPSTGQPMTEQKFYETMGWTERTANERIDQCRVEAGRSHL